MNYRNWDNIGYYIEKIFDICFVKVYKVWLWIAVVSEENG